MLHDNGILVLGAGELGMAVLRTLVRRTAPRRHPRGSATPPGDD
jgi:hypothetical protein